MRRARCGSSQSLNSHSMPIRRTALGALGICPEMKSKAPPTPMATLTPVRRSRFRWIQKSCLGQP
jgi:L,D-peptidoglycan transpeptidase YkuD (ErfK/YbiS/YcfS/YnhG family)